MIEADGERLYSEEDIVDLLTKAAALGLDIEKGSDLEELTIAELDRLVNKII